MSPLVPRIISILAIIFELIVQIDAPSARAASSLDHRSTERALPKILTDSIIYGVGAGTLVGIASISDFHKNIGLNKDPQNVFRGASWGLYGGIVLGIYLAYFAPGSEQKKSDPNSDTPGPVSLGQTQFAWQFTF